QKIALEEREKLSFRAAWVFIASKGNLRNDRQRAEAVASEDAQGDFAELARRYSDDDATKVQGGVLGVKRLVELPPALRRVVEVLEVGQVSGAFPVGNGWAVIKLLERQPTELPSYAEARRELGDRVYM